MKEPIIFPYKIYKNYPCPIIRLSLNGGKGWVITEAYIDSGASVSLFSTIDAQRLGLDYTKGRKTFSMVGDGSLIPIYTHKLLVKISNVSLNASIGFSPRLGVGFNLLGRQDIFTHFDITFSDATKTITFIPRR